jgi:RecA/RadA recombinase
MADKLSGVLKGLKAEFGSTIMGSADKLALDNVKLSTGSLALDIALGGGIPLGRAALFFGEKSCGKTTTAIRTAGLAQHRCSRCYRMAKNVEAVPPTTAELEEDPTTRWTAKGECDCIKQGLVPMPDPPARDKENKESAKDYKERVEAWSEALQANSYEEFIVVWVDPEGAFEKEWAAKVGLDPRRLYYIVTGVGEEAVDIITAILSTTNADMIVVDSLAHLTPKVEYEVSSEEWQQGLQARITNKGIRRFIVGQNMAIRARRRATQIWVNQTRMKIGVTFGEKMTKPGGKGQDFAVHTEIRFQYAKVETLEEKYGAQDKGEVITIPHRETFHIKVTKDKVGGKGGSNKHVETAYTQAMRDTPGITAGTVIEDELIFKLCMKFLVEEVKKGKQVVGYRLGDEEYKTQKALKEVINDDPVKRAVLMDTLIETVTRLGA